MRDLPAGWAWATVGDVGEVRLGRQRSPKNHDGPRMMPYLRAANVTWRGLAMDDVKFMQFSEAESKVYELQRGDVLLAEASGSASEVGKPALWRGELDGCCFQNTLIRVRPRSAVVASYLLHYFWLQARSGRFADASKGVGIHHLGAQRLASLEVPVPPQAEQRRIVAAIEEQFSRLDAAGGLLGRSALRLERLRQAAIDASFPTGVSTAPLESSIRAPLANGRSVRTEPGGFPVLTLSAIRSGAVDPAESKEGAWNSTEASPFLVAAGDYLICRGNGSLRLVGRGGLVRPDPPAVAFPDTIIRVRADPGLLIPEFLRVVWDSARVRGQLEARARTTAGIYKISQADIRAIHLPVLDLDEQRRIVAEVEQRLSVIDAMEAAIRDAQARSRALRRAILDRAFRGELVPQDPMDEPASALLEHIRAEREAAAKAAPRRGVRSRRS